MDANKINHKAVLHLHEMLEEAETKLRYAAGYISTTKEWRDKHPQDVLTWLDRLYLEEKAKDEKPS